MRRPGKTGPHDETRIAAAAKVMAMATDART
jgi:hypothetical protein